jgi:hypothetical protein
MKVIKEREKWRRHEKNYFPLESIRPFTLMIMNRSQIIDLFRQNRIPRNEWEKLGFSYAEWILEWDYRNANETRGRRSHGKPHCYSWTSGRSGLSPTAPGCQVRCCVKVTWSSAARHSCCTTPVHSFHPWTSPKIEPRPFSNYLSSHVYVHDMCLGIILLHVRIYHVILFFCRTFQWNMWFLLLFTGPIFCDYIVLLHVRIYFVIILICWAYGYTVIVFYLRRNIFCYTLI